ncbi:MAG: DNA cytosine methyltransferase, partial [Gammaproteobacteria bacterium]|nr:DNA cytosine methyltransferase [Gammaproteobacteria bacterium]
KHWPKVPRYGNIREIRTLPYADLICGGFPCQPFSHAGKRRGTKDDRWLWPEFYRVICEVRPRWVFVENIPGLLSIDSGRVFAGILKDLSEAGYDAEWFTLRASDFGAPHKRERIFIVAHARSEESGRIPSGSREEIPEIGGCFGNSENQLVKTLREVPEGQDTDSRGSDKHAPATDSRRPQNGWPEGYGKNVHSRNENLRSEAKKYSWDTPWFEVAACLCGVDDGLPVGLDRFKLTKAGHRVKRLKALGNAVVPQVAEFIGRRIIEFDDRRKGLRRNGEYGRKSKVDGC